MTRPADALATAIAARLRASGSVFAEQEADLLVLAAERDPAHQLESLVRAREDGQPLEHLIGAVQFRGLSIPVGPGVFVPRQRSAYLVDTALDMVRETSTVLDLCCGCGALGYALLRAAECEIDVWATDLDPQAVAYAQRLMPSGRALHGDLFDAVPASLRSRLDLIIVNAPYVPSGRLGLMPPEARDHEPLIALDGGDDGLALHRRIAMESPGWLTPLGRIVTEVGVPQIPAATELYRSAGFDVVISRDEERDATALIAWRGRRSGEG